MKRFAFFGFLFGLFIISASAQKPWECQTYPDENGFTQRTAGMLQQIASQGFGKRSLANSRCPDTGLPVKTWAVKGDTIISPYTGRKYVQGNTGYFGPKARDAQGRILAFGGDPLKYDLPPATATLLLDPENQPAKAFLTIPGNLRQQYHFAAKNWVRFYGLLGSTMPPQWHKAFQEAIANYAEKRRPSDGDREHAPLSHAHNLVGEPNHLLGGNKKDGGTENHKTMWRTSALLYAQLFPENSKISGYTTKQAEEMTTKMIRQYIRRTFEVGNGEYDSQIYYPHSIAAFLNLFDFSPKPRTRLLAKTILDYYLATYGLKVIDGTIAGAQKRGYLATSQPNEMERYLYALTGATCRPMTPKKRVASIHLATTSYRPNRIIFNILTKNIQLPFEAQIARPFYHADKKNAFQESFFCSESYALGNVAMTLVDNPNQQTVWSLVAKGTQQPLCFGGQQPYRLNPAGHSQYSQSVHKKSALIVMSAPTGEKPQRKLTYEEKSRFQNAAAPLAKLEMPKKITAENLNRFFEKARLSAATWFFLPRCLPAQQIVEKNGKIFIHANETFLVLIPFSKNYHWLDAPEQILAEIGTKDKAKILNEFRVLIFPGKISGFILDSGEKNKYKTMGNFIAQVEKHTQTDFSRLSQKQVSYTSLKADRITMRYVDTGLRAQAEINGKALDYANWAGGGVYQSPYIEVKDGVFSLNDGREGYRVDFRGETPVYQEFDPKASKKK